MITDPVTGQKNWKMDTNVISVATINQALETHLKSTI